MITIRHLVTGERQWVASLAGIDTAEWEATGEPVPPDLVSQPYQAVSDVITPVAPPPTFRDALLALLVGKGTITQAEADALPPA